jgi:signal transduction histidine kinase
MQKMLKNLHWRLTLIYFFAAIGLVSLISAGAYFLMRHNLQQNTDQALQYRMAAEFKKYDIPLPAELKTVQHQWLKNNSSRLAVVTQPSQSTSIATEAVYPPPQSSGSESESDDFSDDEFDGNLSAVFVTTNDNNQLATKPIQVPAPIEEDTNASQNALLYGVDWRIIQLSDGTRVRLLTYRTSPNSIAPDVLQVGRLLKDQDLLLKQYLIGLLVFGAVMSVFLALISWLFAGRMLNPAQQAWDQQHLFIANASHELRTPLTLLRATADFGIRNQPAPQQKDILQDIINECDYMNHLVDDLLLISRLDARKQKLEIEPVSLTDLLDEIVHHLEPLAREKNISLVQESMGGTVFADRFRLRQVLLILLDNALRYTPSTGSIRIHTRSLKHSLEINITDNGRGIPPQYLPLLFDRFYQLPGQDDARHNGLGLSIAKALVEAQRGTIHIESTLSKGTHVWFTLPTP